MDVFLNFPNILWKISELGNFCKKSSPSFGFYGAKWKLKLAYRESFQGGVVQIILKKSGKESLDQELNVNAAFLQNSTGTIYFPRTTKLTKSALNEWILWEETVTNVVSKFTHHGIINHINKFLHYCSFTCYMKPTILSGVQKDFSDILLYEGPGELTAGSSSPCVTSLCHDFANLFNNHLMSDVILTCDNTKIYAHKAVLAARSEFFAGMFRTDMKESKEGTIEVKDIEPSVLKQLVRYMYSGEMLELSSDNVHQLYVAADKYRVEALKMKCGVFMVDNQAVATVSQPVQAPELSEDSSLKEAIVSHFAAIKEVLCSKEWQKLSEKEPKFAQEAFLFFVSKSP